MELVKSKTLKDRGLELSEVSNKIIQLLKISDFKNQSSLEEVSYTPMYYFEMMEAVSYLIEENCKSWGLPLEDKSKQKQQLIQGPSSHLEKQSHNQQSISFIYRSEFKTIMIVLFSLIEHNLRGHFLSDFSLKNVPLKRTCNHHPDADALLAEVGGRSKGRVK
mmetsp:Transcript_28393/g.27333  ORF Transcript_28393/g.27333 Transcript_28393/m.27333 type:complete len:163 (+) Transcript_28393:1335-1823(+)